MFSVTTTSAQETRALGVSLGRSLRGGAVLALWGPLGSGKTTFVQGLARGLGLKKPITSPTFLLARAYPIPGKRKIFYHVDLYRLKGINALLELGLAEILASNHIVAIEWPKVARKILPRSTILINFRHYPKQPHARHITITNA